MCNIKPLFFLLHAVTASKVWSLWLLFIHQHYFAIILQQKWLIAGLCMNGYIQYNVCCYFHPSIIPSLCFFSFLLSFFLPSSHLSIYTFIHPTILFYSSFLPFIFLTSSQFIHPFLSSFILLTYPSLLLSNHSSLHHLSFSHILFYFNPSIIIIHSINSFYSPIYLSFLTFPFYYIHPSINHPVINLSSFLSFVPSFFTFILSIHHLHIHLSTFHSIYPAFLPSFFLPFFEWFFLSFFLPLLTWSVI